MTRIEEFGWRGVVEPGIGRIVCAHGDYYHLVCNEASGEIIARKKKSIFSGKNTKTHLVKKDCVETLERGEDVAIKPMTGDFVRFRYNAAGESLVTEILPRFSKFERKDSNARRKSQVLAVNFDTLFVMMGLNENFSIPRLERFLVLAEDLGEASVVVVLTKADLVDLDYALKTANELSEKYGVQVFAVSSIDGTGLEELKKFVAPGKTVAFVGSSGVGKSTLLNALAGEELAATQEIQEWSGKGRHTTTSRNLLRIPSGALVLDTPGVREIGIVGEIEEVRAKGTATHRWRK
jgi:ribosome biogenesis GTPase